MSNLRKDFIYKLLTNLFRIPVSFSLQAIFPRLLGPAGYGTFDFLTDSSNKIITFFETGTSIAFYTRLSQDNSDKKLVRFYWMLVFAISGLYLTFVFLSAISGIYRGIWPDQGFYFIILSAFWGLATYYSNTTLKMLDAYHLTVRTEKLRMWQLFLSVLVFGVIFFTSRSIGLETFFYVQILLLVILFVGTAALLKSSGYVVIPSVEFTKQDIGQYKKLFWNFSSPLLVYALVSLLSGVGDRWILQKFGGNIQQAYFGISFKVGSFVFLFASAMMPLLMREFSKLSAARDRTRLIRIYEKNIRILFFIASYLAVCVACNAKFITLVLGGKGYEQAAVVMALMAFYPIHQTLGQINGSFFYATSRTRQYRNVGLFILPLGLCISFLLIAPKEYYGLNLGAVGLACQMLGIQVLSVNIMLFLNCRFLQLQYMRFAVLQVGLLAILGGVGLLISYLLGFFDLGILLNSIIFFILFSIFSAALIFTMPSAIGIDDREELSQVLKFWNK